MIPYVVVYAMLLRKNKDCECVRTEFRCGVLGTRTEDIKRDRRKLQCEKFYYSRYSPIVNNIDQIKEDHKYVQSFFCRKTRR